MGCKYACVCGGRCSDYCFVPESYFGEAEDVMAQQRGFPNDDAMRAYYKQQEEEERKYWEEMEKEEYKRQEEDFLRGELDEIMKSPEYQEAFEQSFAKV